MPTNNRIISESRKSDKVSSPKKTKAGNTLTAKIPVYEPNIPEPKCWTDLIKYLYINMGRPSSKCQRDDICRTVLGADLPVLTGLALGDTNSDWITLSLDDRTANKVLWITDGGAKVARMTDDITCPVLDRPERYEYTPQVLCKEGFLGSRGYWEIQSSGWVVIGVAFEGAGRRNSEGPCGFGENEESWGLEWSGSCYQVWHKGQRKEINGIPHHSTIGVYVDQPAGILSFYAVKELQEGGEGTARKEVKPLHQIRSSFKQKLLPGFWVGTHSYCLILKKEE